MKRWRAIRNTVHRSESLAKLSDFAERLYWHILARSDDWGRGPGHARKVKADCVPMLAADEARVQSALEELVAVGRLELYLVGGEWFYQITDFDLHQPKELLRKRHLNGQTSEFPDPTAGKTPANDERNRVEENRVEEKTTDSVRRDEAGAQLVNGSQPGVAVGQSQPHELSAQTLLAAYIDEARSRGVEPPARIKGQLGRELKNLVGEGQPEWALRSALSLLVSKALGPSQLASCVQQVQLEREKPASRRFGRGVTAEEVFARAGVDMKELGR